MTAPPVAIKIIRTFAFAFAGVFVPCLIGLLSNTAGPANWTVWKAGLVSGIFAGCAAGLRAVAAFLPVFADDNVGIQKKS